MPDLGWVAATSSVGFRAFLGEPLMAPSSRSIAVEILNKCFIINKIILKKRGGLWLGLNTKLWNFFDFYIKFL
jgi:hypothetical protein